VLVDTALPIARVSIGLPDVAEVSATTPTEIMVSGKAPGETSLIIWDIKGGRQFFNVTVRAPSTISNDSLDAIRREIRAELPGQSIKLSSENGMIFMRGTVKNLNSSERAMKIASIAGKVINLLDVEVPAADPQILLKVRFISVDRNKETQLGINLADLGGLNTVGSLTTGQYTPPSVANNPTTATFGNELNLFALNPGNLPIALSIQALETKGVVQVLSQPNVIAANGKQASFLAGGEFPFPVSSGLAGQQTISITFKEYGVRLNFIPTITPRGTIRLQVAPEVSSLDFTNAIEISGFEIPAIDTRKVQTEVELADGQSFVIGGLLDDRDTESYLKIPFLGDIPILGKFFQSMQKTRTNTELIVIVTPEIVAPIQAGAPLPELKFPTKFLPPNSGIPMNNPDAKTAANTPAPAPAAIPVEKLIDSLKPETPLMVQGASGNFGGGSQVGANTTAAPSSSQ
jgi:pilus assembly protein CpaC